MRCPTCSVVHEAGTEYCATDGSRLVATDAAAIGRLQTVALPNPPSSPFLRVSAAPAVVPAAQPAFGELPAGLLVGEFQIQEKIGQGGMAVVYLGLHPVIGKRAAIKVLNADFARDAGAVSRFVQEARAVNQIGHRNIVDIFQFGQLPDGRNFLVMELLEGRSLAAHLRARGALPLSDMLAIALPICDALGAAHETHIVHRDLKPDNVFLEELRQGGMHVKLLDFGIAKLNHLDAAGPTKSGTMIGTPHYMAPEQIRAGAVDARADVYSLGVVVYEMLTGRTPHDAETIYTLIAHKLNTRPSRPSAFARVPPDLEALILRCLELDPDRRPQTMAEVHRELCSIAQAEGIPIATASASVPIPLATLPPATARPRRRGWLLAGLGALLLGAGVLLTTLPGGSRPERRPPPQPVSPVVEAAAPAPPQPPPSVVASSGSLLVRTNVAQAMFYLDDKLVGDGTGTLRLDEVAPGAHAIRVEAAAHQARSASIEVRAGKPTSAFVALEPRRPPATTPRKQQPPRKRGGRDLPDPFAD